MSKKTALLVAVMVAFTSLAVEACPQEPEKTPQVAQTCIPIGNYPATLLTGGYIGTIEYDKDNALFTLAPDSLGLSKEMVSDCTVVARVHANIGTERAHYSLQRLSCTDTAKNIVVALPLQGFVVGTDGMEGVKGVTYGATLGSSVVRAATTVKGGKGPMGPHIGDFLEQTMPTLKVMPAQSVSLAVTKNVCATVEAGKVKESGKHCGHGADKVAEAHGDMRQREEPTKWLPAMTLYNTSTTIVGTASTTVVGPADKGYFADVASFKKLFKIAGPEDDQGFVRKEDAFSVKVSITGITLFGVAAWNDKTEKFDIRVTRIIALGHDLVFGSTNTEAVAPAVNSETPKTAGKTEHHH